ncbi:OLC1v1016736C1 [Oldenlandia corymbosa var. corymbosa]|uniref:OLC1v1016736C1 n=1 Tax=Oldenlandia corymbosa var. corymbosa TaxID=529605 RepID=A0AAV1E7S7_OLDCO|nr:OLC1v1016736C1 [Oldenlandia corymbosa var. corymbosa]
MAILNKPIASPDGKILMRPEEFKKWLKKFDADKDGRISTQELREAIRANGGWFTTRKGRDGVRMADKDGSGYIDDNEINNLKDFALKYLGVKIITY